MIILLLVFALTAAIFVVYDVVVERRHPGVGQARNRVTAQVLVRGEVMVKGAPVHQVLARLADVVAHHARPKVRSLAVHRHDDRVVHAEIETTTRAPGAVADAIVSTSGTKDLRFAPNANHARILQNQNLTRIAKPHVN